MQGCFHPNSLDKWLRNLFHNEPKLYMQYIQGKILLYAVIFSEYKTVLRKLLLRRVRFHYAFDMIRNANKGDRRAVARFLGAVYNEQRVSWNMVTERIRDVLQLSEEFLGVFHHCFLDFTPTNKMELGDCVESFFSKIGMTEIEKRK
ncbi:hypothetical protein PMAYCL1PPCAC_21516, partial [Pristionchus mayeri]